MSAVEQPVSDDTLAALLATPLAGLSVAPRVVTVVTPAAAANWSIAVPADVVWYPQGIVATLTTDANVANRQADLEITDGTTVHTRVAGPALHLASLAVRYSWTRGVPGQAAVTAPASWQAGFPLVPVLPNHTIQVTTRNIQAADAWTAIALYVLELRTRDVDEVVDILNARMGGQHMALLGLASQIT